MVLLTLSSSRRSQQSDPGTLARTKNHRGGKSHLFEVAPDGQIVWDFVNPYVKEDSQNSIYRCTRYSPQYVRPLLARAAGDG